MNRPIVTQENVGNRAQPRKRVVVFVGDRLVRAVAAGHHQRHVTHPIHQQVVQRRVGEHAGPSWDCPAQLPGRPCGQPSSSRRARSTIGRSADSSSACSWGPTWQIRRAAATSATIRASGFSSRSFLRRNSITAWALRGIAGQMVAPQSLHGPDFPGQNRRGKRGERIGVRDRLARQGSAIRAADRSRDKRSAGHETGDRPDSRIPPGMQSTWRKPAIVVRPRSYGAAGDDRQSRAAIGAIDEGVAEPPVRPDRAVRPGTPAHVATSAGSCGRPPPPSWTLPPGRMPRDWAHEPEESLSTIRKPHSPLYTIRLEVIDSIRASAGGRCFRASRNRSIARLSPSTSIATPSARLRTKPANRHSVAKRCTKGRKPTPCTMPRTTTARRSMETPRCLRRHAGRD